MKRAGRLGWKVVWAVAAALTCTTGVVENGTPIAPRPGGPLLFSNVGAHGLSLSWTAASDDTTAPAALQYRVFQASTPDLLDVTSTLAQGTALNDWTANLTHIEVTGLTPFTNYAFNVLVRDADDNTASYTMANAFTLPDGAPRAVGSVTVADATATSVTLTWNAAHDDEDAPSVLRYRVYRSAGPLIDTVEHVLDVGAPLGEWEKSTSAVISDLTEGASLYVNVLVQDSAGNLAAYNMSRVQALDVTAPVAGGAVSVSSVRGHGLQLSWPAASDNVTPANALEYRAFVASTDALATLPLALQDGRELTTGWSRGLLSLPVTGLSSETHYWFAVFVRDAAEHVTKLPGADATTLALTAPTPGTLSVTEVRATEIHIAWSAATPADGTNDDFHYRAYISATGPLGTLEEVQAHGEAATPWGTMSSATLTGLSGSTNYWVTLVVRSSDDVRALYDGVAVRTGDVLPPQAASVMAALVPPAGALLVWESASDDTSAPEALMYRLERVEGGPPSPLTSPLPGGEVVFDWQAGVSEWSVPGLAGSTSYTFVLFVRDEAGLVSAYPPAEVDTGLVVYPTLFSPTAQHGTVLFGANMGGRAGADAYCAAYLPAELTDACVNGVRAVLNVDASDQLENFPALYGVPANVGIKNLAGELVATHWASLLAEPPDLASALVLPADRSFWTGALLDGALDPTNTCTGWTVGTNASQEPSGGSGGEGSSEPEEGSTSGGDPSTSGGGSSGGPPPASSSSEDPPAPTGAAQSADSAGWRTQTWVCTELLALVCLCY